MKKTLNINLAGYPFTIDEDAYNLLKDYLDTIRYAFHTNDDTEDLAVDIESRIAELLIENEAGGVKIVSKQEVTKVIERIGKPSDFIEITEEDASETSSDISSDESEQKISVEETITPPPYQPNKQSRNPFVRKRIFRDPQNSMLGGVCAGIANYLHIDVTVVRLITVLLFFLSASTVAIIYIILWIVVPEANTPFQRMQMMGEDPTVENIGKSVTENYQDKEKVPFQNDKKSGFASFLSSALSIFVKCLIFFGLFIAILLLIAFGAAFLGCAIAIFVIGIGLVSGGMFDSFAEGLMVLYILLAVIGGTITLGIPAWLFLKKFWKKKESASNPSNQRALLIAWFCGMALVAIFSVKAVKQAHKVDKLGISWEKLEEINNIDGNDIDDIKITRDGIIIKTTNGTKYEISKGMVISEGKDNTDVISSETNSVVDSMTIETDSIKIIQSVTETDSLKSLN